MTTAKHFVTYRDFGAKGDGKIDDFAAIIAAHAYANEHGLPVRATKGDIYYIGPRTASAIIMTDTDWRGSSFIIDDSNVTIADRYIHTFHVRRDNTTGIDLLSKGVTTLKEGQTILPYAPGTDCYVNVLDTEKYNYIREGLNQNNGQPQTDCFLLHADGSVDPTTPIIWNFDHITEMIAYPIEIETLTITGGTFTTIANQAESKYNYYTTGIMVTRSNVIIDGLTHYIEGELDHGAPYDGMIQVYSCANVTVKNCLLTAHYIYVTIGAAKKPVSMGTYDIRCQHAVNVSFHNCSQTTDIMDRRYWGLFTSNYCKNLTLDNCKFSRFDAHMGVTNATIRNCTLGHQCLNIIGHGTLTVENSTLFGQGFINLRKDYGSTWKGDIFVRNCIWHPAFNQDDCPCFIQGSYNGSHDFGFDCYMPQHITIDGLTIQDESQADNKDYQGIYLLDNITPENKDESFAYTYPYHITKTISIKNFSSSTGKQWILSENPFMYRDTVVNK